MYFLSLLTVYELHGRRFEFIFQVLTAGVSLETLLQNADWPFPCSNIDIQSTRLWSKPRIHEHPEWFANRSQTVRELNVRICGRDCKPVLPGPQ